MASSKRSSCLPPELIEEILYRTPAESLIRFQTTCKQWYALITEKRFIYNHLRRSPERFIRTLDTVQIMDPVTGTRSDSPIPKEFQYPYDIETMVHCDGLMLCMCRRQRGQESTYVNVALWNPLTRKIRWMKPSTCFTTSDYYGVGYDNGKSRDGYKILRFYDRYYGRFWDSRDQEEYAAEAKVEIYECKTNSWKTLDVKVDWAVDFSCKGVAVMGNMYWLCQKMGRDYILGFDFSLETFKDICTSPPSYDYYLSCFNGDRLSLLRQEEESRQIEVWVSSKLADGNVSFTKYLSVSSTDLPPLRYHTDMANPVYCLVKHKRIIAWCEGDDEEDDKVPTCITLYEIDEGGLRKQLETERHYNWGYSGPFLCGYVYVPSLIPLPW